MNELPSSSSVAAGVGDGETSGALLFQLPSIGGGFTGGPVGHVIPAKDELVSLLLSAI